MAHELTVGILNDIFSAEQPIQKDNFPVPILQVLQIKLLNSAPGAPERYRVVFSDSQNFVQSIISSQCNFWIHENKLRKGVFIRLTDFDTNSIKGKRVLMVLALEVLEHLGESEKIGEPAALQEGGEPAQQDRKPPVQPQRQQQQQQGANANTFYGNQNQPKGGIAPPAARAAPKFAGGGGQKNNAITVAPIESISPYQNKCTIKARVTFKSEVKTWHNQRGEGKLFSVNLLDQSGEIKATGFGDQCTDLYDLFQEGSVYYISKCQVNLAKKQFSTLDNEYEITFQRDSEVTKAEDADDDVPKPKFNFVNLSELQNMEKDAVVDIVAVIKEIGETAEIVSKTTQKPFQKRDLTVVDNTGYSVKLTIWGKTAQSFEAPVESVVAFKGLKVSDFGGRSLSLLSSGTMMLDPDMDEAHRLKGWFDAEGRSSTYSTHQGMATSMGVAGGANQAYKTIQQVKDENLGMNDTPDTFSTKATIVYIKQQGATYPACKSEGCNKKVIESPEGSGNWVCEKCQLTHPRPQHRYIMNVSVNDATGQAWFSCFDDVGKLIMGRSADDLMDLGDSDNAAFGEAFNEANCKSYVFRVRAKMDSFNEQTRVRYQVLSAVPINYATEALRLAKLIESYNI